MSELINFTSSEINALLGSIGSVTQLSTNEKENLVKAINELVETCETISNSVELLGEGTDAKIGILSGLLTSEKKNLVGAINEVFTFAGEGKSAIAAAITGSGISASSGESWASLSSKIAQIRSAWIEPIIDNDDSITPTGSYATSTYYNLDYGVKVGYCSDGSILLSMKAGTTTAYENINFELGTVPSGVTITKNSTSYDTSDPAGNLFVCVLSGITAHCTIGINMSSYNASYDYVTATINITEAAA